MDVGRIAAAAGILFAAAVAVLVGATYALLDPTAVGPYFAAGPASPLLLALFALVAIVVLAAGATDRWRRVFWPKMKDQGVYLSQNQYESQFVTYAHTEDDVEETLEAYRNAL